MQKFSHLGQDLTISHWNQYLCKLTKNISNAFKSQYIHPFIVVCKHMVVSHIFHAAQSINIPTNIPLILTWLQSTTGMINEMNFFQWRHPQISRFIHKHQHCLPLLNAAITIPPESCLCDNNILAALFPLQWSKQWLITPFCTQEVIVITNALFVEWKIMHSFTVQYMEFKFWDYFKYHEF